MDLTRFLVGYTARPFRWGQDDCSLILADWWQANHDNDPARELRGAYSDRASKTALLADRGGLILLVERLARAAGAPPTETPQRGDLGLIHAGEEPIGGICCGGGFWAIRNEQGIGFLKDPRIVKAWKV